MGLLDNLIKIVESGSVEKTVASKLEAIEKVVNSTFDTAEQGLKKAEKVATKTTDAIDVVARKLPDDTLPT